MIIQNNWLCAAQYGAQDGANGCWIISCKTINMIQNNWLFWISIIQHNELWGAQYGAQYGANGCRTVLLNIVNIIPNN